MVLEADRPTKNHRMPLEKVWYYLLLFVRKIFCYMLNMYAKARLVPNLNASSKLLWMFYKSKRSLKSQDNIRSARRADLVYQIRCFWIFLSHECSLNLEKHFFDPSEFLWKKYPIYTKWFWCFFDKFSKIQIILYPQWHFL